jgi:hypothetical protein
MSELKGHARHARPASRLPARAAAAVAGVIAVAAVGAVSVSAAANAAGGCQVAYTENSWPGGFTASISITNLGASITNWTLGFTLPGGEVVGQGWSATFGQTGQNVTATNVSYNGSLGTNASVSIGFNGTFPGATYPGDPATFTLNGISCTGGVTPSSPTPSTTGSSPSPSPGPSPSSTPPAGSGPAVQNDVFWKDTSGNPIYSQGGGVLKVGNTY